MPLDRSPAWRRRVASLLDASIAVTGSVAVVILLGGRTRAALFGMQIALISPLNPALAAAVLLAIRVVWFGRLRAFPSFPLRPLGPDSIERDRWVSRDRATADVYVLAAACLLGSLVWIWPHITHIRKVPDAGDPVFSAWRIARFTHQLTHDPAHLFDGNIFYPRPLTMTYSDATVLQGLLAAPLLLAGIEPLVASNIVFLLAFPACGLAFFYAGWRFSGDPRAALVAGLIGAWYPFHAEHYSHMELQFSMFVPLAIVLVLRTLAAPGWRNGAWLGAAVGLQWLASMYLGVMLITGLVPFGVLLAVAWRVRPSRQMAGAALVATVVALVCIVPTAVPYLESRSARGDRQLEEVSQGSALPEDYAQPGPLLANYVWMSRGNGRTERRLFPGVSTVALAGAGIVPPLGAPAIALTTTAAFAFDWSLGLNGLTYDDLYRDLPPYRGMRVAARFDALLGCVLALLASIGALRLIRLPRRCAAQAAVTAALTIFVLWDLRINLRLTDYYPSIPSIYRRVTPADVLAEFPTDRDIDFMYFSTAHWAHLLGGYSGFSAYSPDLLAAWKAFPSPAGVDALQKLGATRLTYNCALELRSSRCGPTFEALEANPELTLVASEKWNGAEVRLYRFVDAR